MKEHSPSVRLADLCLRFARVERATHHPDGERPETDADHTLMLAVFACAVADNLNDNRTRDWLDVGLVAQFAIVHDFPEVHAGDVNTLADYDKDAKEAREAEAVARIKTDHGAHWPWLPEMIQSYRFQLAPEARLVRFLDKFVVKFAHTLNGGASLRKLGVGLEALKERHRLQIDELAEEYPELARVLGPMLREACDEAEAAYGTALAVRPLYAGDWIPAPTDEAGFDALPDGTKASAYMTSRLMVKRGRYWVFEDGHGPRSTSRDLAATSHIQPDRMVRLP